MYTTPERCTEVYKKPKRCTEVYKKPKRYTEVYRTPEMCTAGRYIDVFNVQDAEGTQSVERSVPLDARVEKPYNWPRNRLQ